MSAPVWPTTPQPHCACGCGELITNRRSENYREWCRFIAGHQCRGEHNYKWNGGTFTSARGYVFVKRPDHPKAPRQTGYVKRAVLVAEEKLGRFLRDGEVVHHINGDKSDDRRENLRVFQSNSEHIQLHCKEWLGSGSPNAKLTETDIETIRSLRGVATLKELAVMFGVSLGHVGRIISGERRTHG